MMEKYPESLVPPLPEKSIQEKIAVEDSVWVEQRRDGLQRFMDSIKVHPLLSKTEEFREFITKKTFYYEGHDASIPNQVRYAFYNKLPKIKSFFTKKPQILN